MSSICGEGTAMQRLFSLLVVVLLSLSLAGCHRGGASNNAPAPSGGSPSQQLSWDQGNWNQTNWQ
jgi:predicted small lipoprotein YifL